MSLIEEVYDEFMRFDAGVSLPREDLAIIMRCETFRRLHCEYLSQCCTPITRSVLSTDQRFFGLPVILSRDIKEPFCFAYIPRRATEKGGAE